MLLGGLSTSLGTTWLVRRPMILRVKGAGIAIFGLAIGLPMSLPGLVLAWTDARAEEGKNTKRKNRVATKDDRRDFAENLGRQVRELSDPARDVRGSIGGDGGTVLKLEGDLAWKEGERLTAALRGDLKDVGFKRVEGGSAKSWWVRV